MANITILSVAMSHETYTKVEEAAKQDTVSKAEIVRRALENYFDIRNLPFTERTEKE